MIVNIVMVSKVDTVLVHSESRKGDDKLLQDWHQ